MAGKGLPGAAEGIIESLGNDLLNDFFDDMFNEDIDDQLNEDNQMCEL